MILTSRLWKECSDLCAPYSLSKLFASMRLCCARDRLIVTDLQACLSQRSLPLWVMGGQNQPNSFISQLSSADASYHILLEAPCLYRKDGSHSSLCLDHNWRAIGHPWLQPLFWSSVIDAILMILLELYYFVHHHGLQTIFFAHHRGRVNVKNTMHVMHVIYLTQ